MSITKLKGSLRPISSWVKGLVEEVDPGQTVVGTLADGENLLPLKVPRLSTRGGSRIMLTLRDGVSAAPVHVGTSAFFDSTGALPTIDWPAHQAGDIALLFVESANEAIALSTPAGFVEIPDSPQGTGAAGGVAATRLAVFWCRAVSAAMAPPGVADPGDHACAQMFTFRGCIAAGNPWDVTSGDVAAAAVNAVAIPGDTTTVDNTLVVVAVANGTDIFPGAPECSGFANAALVGMTQIGFLNSDQGNGGGFAVAYGRKGPAGVYPATTAVLVTASVQGRISIALRPATPPVTGVELGHVVALAQKAALGAVAIGWSPGTTRHYAYAVTADMAFAGATEALSRTALPADWNRATPGRPSIANLFEKLYVADATLLYSARSNLVCIDALTLPGIVEPTFQFDVGPAAALRPYCLEEYNNVLFIAGYGDESAGDAPALVRHSFLGQPPDAALGFDKSAYNTIGAKGDRVTAMRKGRGILIVAKANELYKISGFGRAYPGWQYQVEGIQNTEGYGVENAAAFDHAGGYWFGIGKQGPFRTDGITVDSIVGPRQRTWAGIDHYGESWVRYHPERNLMLFGVHVQSGAPDDTYPWIILAWDCARNVWQPNWRMATNTRFFTARSVASAPGAGDAPVAPPVAIEPDPALITTTQYEPRWTNGDPTAQTEFWENVDGGAYAFQQLLDPGVTTFVRAAEEHHIYRYKLRHRKSGILSAYSNDVQALTQYNVPAIVAMSSDPLYATMRVNVTTHATPTGLLYLYKRLTGTGDPFEYHLGIAGVTEPGTWGWLAAHPAPEMSTLPKGYDWQVKSADYILSEASNIATEPYP